MPTTPAPQFDTPIGVGGQIDTNSGLIKTGSLAGSYAGTSSNNYAPATITSSSMKATTPVIVPPPATPTDPTAAYNAGGAAVTGATAGVTTPAPTDTSGNNEFKTLYDQYVGALPTPPSATDTYNADYASSGIDTAQTQFNSDQKALLDAQAGLKATNAQLAALNATGTSQQLQAQNREAPQFIVSGEQSRISRDTAIQALPLQAQALAQGANIAALQGNLDLSQNILKQAQDHLTTMFNLQMQDAQTTYQYKTDLLKSVYDFATASEQRQLDAQQHANDQAFDLKKMGIQNSYDTARENLNFQHQVAIKNMEQRNTAAGALSILDVARYNDLYPNAGVTAGDTEAQANAKIAASNTPEGKLRNLVLAAQSNGNDYATVMKEIQSDKTITDKDLATKIANEVYKVTPTPPSKIETDIAQLSKSKILTSADIRASLRNRGYTQAEVNNSSVGSTLDRIGSFLFGNK